MKFTIKRHIDFIILCGYMIAMPVIIPLCIMESCVGCAYNSSDVVK